MMIFEYLFLTTSIKASTH